MVQASDDRWAGAGEGAPYGRRRCLASKKCAFSGAVGALVRRGRRPERRLALAATRRVGLRGQAAPVARIRLLFPLHKATLGGARGGGGGIARSVRANQGVALRFWLGVEPHLGILGRASS